MALTTQDLKKGIDITGLTTVGGSQMNQLVDTGRLADDKGMVVETQDSALDIPVVPDPNATYSGVSPTWWTRYMWRRLVHASDVATKVRTYVWNVNKVSDAIYLKWELIDIDAVIALALANDAIVDAAAAQATANAALSQAATATTLANNAQLTADDSLANSVATAVIVAELQELINNIWGAGDLKNTCRATIYSVATNQGWVECDGFAISRTVFATLFAVIGVTYGPGDGSTTFNTPDFRGRCLVGAGTGAGGLTARALGQTFGEENHLLTGPESGIALHAHNEMCAGPGSDAIGGGGASRRTFGLTADPLATDTGEQTAATGPVDAAGAHNNCQPSGVARIVMKT